MSDGIFRCGRWRRTVERLLTEIVDAFNDQADQLDRIEAAIGDLTPTPQPAQAGFVFNVLGATARD